MSWQHEPLGARVWSCLGNDFDATHGQPEKSPARQENLKCLKQQEGKDMILEKVEAAVGGVVGGGWQK